MCYIIEYQYYSAKEKGLTFLSFLDLHWLEKGVIEYYYLRLEFYFSA